EPDLIEERLAVADFGRREQDRERLGHLAVYQAPPCRSGGTTDAGSYCMPPAGGCRVALGGASRVRGERCAIMARPGDSRRGRTNASPATAIHRTKRREDDSAGSDRGRRARRYGRRPDD